MIRGAHYHMMVHQGNDVDQVQNEGGAALTILAMFALLMYVCIIGFTQEHNQWRAKTR